MLRRDFLKYLSGIPFVGTLFATGQAGASEGQPADVYMRYGRNMLMPRHNAKRRSGTEYICNTDSSNTGWRFYINDEEIDGSRAVDEHGTLHWPFQGAKDGDLCTAKSPALDGFGIGTDASLYEISPNGRVRLVLDEKLIAKDVIYRLEKLDKFGYKEKREIAEWFDFILG